MQYHHHAATTTASSSLPQHYHQRINMYPPHLVVQRLNSRGAFCIEHGEYEKAIAILIKALNLCERIPDQPPCSCCTIDEFILQTRHPRHQTATAPCNRNQNGKDSSSRRHHHPQSSCYPAYDQYDSSLVEDEDRQEERFIYRQPIITNSFMSSSSYQQKDCVLGGKTLKLVVTLNLAMAYHLSAVDHDLCRRKFQRALHLYESAHQLQTLDFGICSPQATMIIANNVGEIHRCVDNDAKHIMCLEHLLSTMMWLVDNSTSMQQQTCRAEWDGFLRNTSQLILKDITAGAA